MTFIKEVLENVRIKKPLVHNITNYVTVNDCANMILAIGSSPIMADDILEVEEITSICNALVINIGTLNSRTVEAMIIAGKTANKLNIPVILDPVGAGASKFRTSTTLRLLKEIKFTVIRGNISEIKTLALGTSSTIGVDANESDKVTGDNLKEVIDFSKNLSKETGAIIAITGATDIISSENQSYLIKNGNEYMSRITGTGCMLSSIIGVLCGANKENPLYATTVAVAAMGLCGELAYEKVIERKEGTGSFKVYLIDSMSNLSYKTLEGGINVESK